MRKNKWLIAALVAMAMSCAAGAAACSDDKKDNSSNSSGQEQVQPGVELSVDTMSISQYDTATLTYTLTGMSAATPVTWASSDSTIAAVDADGNLTAYKVGVVTITATANGYSDTITVTVTASTDFPSLSLSQMDAKLKVGGTVTVYPTVMFRGDEVDDQPTIEWNTTSEAISLTEKADGSVTITGLSVVENAIVTAKTTYMGKELVQAVTVTVAEDIEFAIDKTEAQLYTYNYGSQYSKTLTLNTTVTLNGNVDENAVVTWSSDAESVATVENGVVTAVSAGEATIIASYKATNGMTYTKECIVTVSVPSININKNAKVYMNAEDGDQIVNISEEWGITDTVSDYKVIDVQTNTELPFTKSGANYTFAITDKKICGERAIKLVVDGEVELTTTLTVVTKVLMTAEDVANMKTYGLLEDVTETGYTLYGYFLLGADVDLSGAGELGIRNYAAGDSKGFIGGFDGQGHTIANMKVTGSGLFGEIAKGTVIRNTAFMSVNVNSDLAGPLGHNCQGVIENCLIVIGFTHGTAMDHCSGVVDALRGEGAVLRNCVVYYPTSNYKSQAISRYFLDGAKCENVAIIGTDKIFEWDNKSGTSVVGVSTYAADVALSDVDFSFVEGDYWKFDGQKVYFNGYSDLIKSSINAGEYPTEIENGEFVTLPTLTEGLEYIIEVADEYKNFVTLEGNMLTIASEISQNFSLNITVSKWNGIDLGISKTVNVIKMQNIVISKTADYVLNTAAGVPNTKAFSANLASELDEDIPANLSWKVLKDGEAVATITDYITVSGKTLSVPANVITNSGLCGEFTLLGEDAEGSYKLKMSIVFITQKLMTAEDLAAFTSASQTGYFVLGENIDASELDIKTVKGRTFSGTFDGRGYAIDGATVYGENGNEEGGLLGATTAGTVVRNVALTNVKIASYSWSYVSPFTSCGHFVGTLENCYVEIVEFINVYDTAALQHVMGLVCHADNATIRNVVIKSIAGLEANVCDMVLGSSNISNVYVIGGGSKHNGWNQNGSPVTATTVVTLSEAQQSTFDTNVWGFENGVPYFKNTRLDLSSAIKLNAEMQKIYANAEDGSQEISLAKLGISGTVEKVYDNMCKPLSFTETDNGFTVSNAKGGVQVMYAVVDGTLYVFDVKIVSNLITTADELVAFASAVQSGYFELGANITANGAKLGATNVTVDGGFSGIFDGCGFVIDGAYVVNGGLFGGISSSGTVKNLGFINTKYGYSGPGSAFGSANYGTIDNCYIQVVEQGYDTNGALQTYCALSAFANVNHGTISNCVSILPEFGTGQHKAVCEYNYGTLQNIYCMGTETTITYTIPGQGTESNVVKVSTLTEAQQATLNADIWNFENGIPTFKNA